ASGGMGISNRYGPKERAGVWARARVFGPAMELSQDGGSHGRESGSRSHRSGIQRQAGLSELIQHLTTMHVSGRGGSSRGGRAEIVERYFDVGSGRSGFGRSAQSVFVPTRSWSPGMPSVPRGFSARGLLRALLLLVAASGCASTRDQRGAYLDVIRPDQRPPLVGVRAAADVLFGPAEACER